MLCSGSHGGPRFLWAGGERERVSGDSKITGAHSYFWALPNWMNAKWRTLFDSFVYVSVH